MKTIVDKSLTSHLWALAKRITSKVDEHHAKGLLVQIRTVYVKPKVANFTYNEGSAGYQTSFTNVEREEWHRKDQHDFIERIIKKLPEYETCVAEIQRKYAAAEPQANFWLSRFCQALAYKAINLVQDEVIVEDIATFVNDLENSQTDWFAKVWIEGVWLSDEECQLNPNTLLRRPRPSDLEDEQPFDLIPIIEPFPFSDAPSAIIELTARGKAGIEIQAEIELMLCVFRLFRLGAVNASKIQLFPRSFLRFSGTHGLNYRFGPPYKYRFGKEDVPKFSLLNQKLTSILPKPFAAAVDKVNPVEISFQRYQDALLQPNSVEGRITSAITSLEALYLKAEERMELSHRLSQRVSSLLRFFDFMPLETYKNLNLAYDIRSKFIHGSPLDKGGQQTSARLCEAVLGYSRMSLLVFFQLHNELSKEALINKLDNSLLDENAYTKLKDLFANNILATR